MAKTTPATPETPETPATPETAVCMSYEIGKLIGKVRKALRKRASRRNKPVVAIWTPAAAIPAQLQCDFLVSTGKRFAIIDTATGLRSIPLSAIIATR